jgi:hypothetical protein
MMHTFIWINSLIDAHLSSMNYDANKLPLGSIILLFACFHLTTASGKLAKSTILQGFGALKVSLYTVAPAA